MFIIGIIAREKGPTFDELVGILMQEEERQRNLKYQSYNLVLRKKWKPPFKRSIHIEEWRHWNYHKMLYPRWMKVWKWGATTESAAMKFHKLGLKLFEIFLNYFFFFLNSPLLGVALKIVHWFESCIRLIIYHNHI